MPRKRNTVYLVLLVLFVMAAAGIGLLRFALHRQLEAVLEPLRSAGVPLTLVELDAYYPAVPLGQNAADVYLSAFAARAETREGLDLPIVGNAEPLRPRERMLDDVKRGMEQYLSANATALDLLHQAASVSQCRYPVDLTLGPEMDLSHLAKVRNAARLLALQAVLLAESGDSTGATQALVDMCAVAGSVALEPIAISQLVRIACDEIAASALERCLNHVTFTEEQLVQLAGAYAALERPESVARATYGDLCNVLHGMDAYGLAAMVNLGPMGGNIGQMIVTYAGKLVYAPTGIRDLDKAMTARAMSTLAHACTQHFPEALGVAGEIDAELGQTPLWLAPCTHISVPALTRMLDALARDLARVRLARAALAVERSRAANGKLPKTLADLVPQYLPAIPEDPFDGAPLRYRGFTASYLLYSIGSNLKDEGGLEPDRNNPRSGDLPFTVDLPGNR